MRAGRNRDGTGRVSGGAKNRRIKVVILVSMRINKKDGGECCLLLVIGGEPSAQKPYTKAK